ncbi:MFS transporter [Jiangella alkaliphila]|uniref:Predicted arabinose efflux permease, MFS family n=1 Tax=Jiangella alkaliphila TaxID=419479 RepID=A0A1H2I5G8_9ACTN|nr:MFS transporter [Jiangella alkaliphila]SDU39351.1 Predicted arabinose efflux permease, MFS family [Jiangella alkaliphila]
MTITTDSMPTTRTRLALLTAATAVGSIGLAAGGLAGPLLAVDLTGDPATAGLPIGVHVAGSAVGAVLVSRVSARAGRPAGLALGYLLGVAGAVIVVAAAAWAGLGLLLAGSAVFGVGNASVFLARYAAAETGGPATRGRALGIVLFAVAAGAVAGPNLLAASGRLASALGLPDLTGLYLISVVAFLAAAALLAPLTLILEKGGHLSGISPSIRRTSPRSTWGRAVVPWRAVALLAVTNLVMVGVMAVAPVHLVGHGHGPAVVGGIVSVHALCMFVPSIVSGRLLDRAGPAIVTTAAALLLVASGVVGAAGADDGLTLLVSLGLLGLGWNAGVLAGSALLTAGVPRRDRLRAEGLGEVAMGLAAGGGAPVAGLVVASGGFTALVIGAAIVMLVVAIPVAVTLGERFGEPFQG